MRCPHCRNPFGEQALTNQAEFILCSRCGRIWVDVGSQRPQGVLESPPLSLIQEQNKLRQNARQKAV